MPYRTDTDLPVSVRHQLPDLTELPGIGENLAHKPPPARTSRIAPSAEAPRLIYIKDRRCSR
jgi:hypothetical protein